MTTPKILGCEHHSKRGPKIGCMACEKILGYAPPTLVKCGKCGDYYPCNYHECSVCLHRRPAVIYVSTPIHQVTRGVIINELSQELNWPVLPYQVAMRHKWPQVNRQIEFGMRKTRPKWHLCQNQMCKVEEGVYVAHCVTQPKFNRSADALKLSKQDKRELHRESMADPVVIMSALTQVLTYLKYRSMRVPSEIHLPEIGCAFGGMLEWIEVSPVVTEVARLAAPDNIPIFVHQRGDL